MTVVITLRGPEPVWTCDANGNWRQETRTRVREGNGWHEIKAPTPSIQPLRNTGESNGRA